MATKLKMTKMMAARDKILKYLTIKPLNFWPNNFKTKAIMKNLAPLPMTEAMINCKMKSETIRR